MQVRLREGLRVEEIDGDAVVLDRDGSTVHRFTGSAVEALRLLADGVEQADVPEHLVSSIDELAASGVVADPAHWSRRKILIAGGAAWGAATIATVGLSLPAAAQALSMCPGGQVSTGPSMFTSAGTYNTGPAELSVLVRAWGGGGGGGGAYTVSPAVNAGGGGGGGEYASTASLTVSPCQMYTVTVGSGGAVGAAGASGSAGGASSFADAMAMALVLANGGGGGMPGASNAAGGTGGTGTTMSNGGNGGSGTDKYVYRGGGGGGGGGSTGAGGAGTAGDPSGALFPPPVGNAPGGMGGSGTPGGGAGGTGGGGLLGMDASAATAPGGAGGGGGTATNPSAGAAGAVWVGY